MINIRQESSNDHKQVYNIHEQAFGQKEEPEIVERIRKGQFFVPELSLVAEMENQVVGHILYSKIKINCTPEFECLALAPVAVLPAFQKQGIGKQLVRAGLKIAKDLDFEAVIVLGHKEYYPKFGFQKAATWSILCPFEVPDEHFMAIELKAGVLEGKAGTVVYPAEFMG